MNILEALRNSAKVFKDGLVTPNKFNKPAADRFKGSALPMLGIPGAVAETADQLHQKNFGSAGLAALGAIPGGMMIGKGAKVWDAIAAEEATRLLRKGIDPHMTTGVHQGVDDILRQEIPDNMAKLKPGAMDTLNASDDMQLQMVLDHPELFKAYPELKEMSVSSMRGMDSTYNPEWDAIGIGRDSLDPLSSTLHEIQHKIQQTEGWAKGGAPSSFQDIDVPAALKRINENSDAYIRAQEAGGIDPITGISKKIYADNIEKLKQQVGEMNKRGGTPHEAYKRLAGEVEARNTQKRQPLTAMERRRDHPYTTMDREIADQAVWGVGEELPGVVQKNVVNALRKNK